MRKLDGKVLVIHNNNEKVWVYLAGQLGEPMDPEDMLWLAEELIKTASKHSAWLELKREEIQKQYKSVGLVEDWHE